MPLRALCLVDHLHDRRLSHSGEFSERLARAMTMAPSFPAKKVLIVDDSRTIRALLRMLIASDKRLTVVGEAGDPFEARALIKALDPDVLTLDIEMPKMSGLEFLKKLMRLRPVPVVMVSSRTTANSREAVQALSLGAVDCVDVARVQSDPLQRHKLTETIFCASTAQVGGVAGRGLSPAVHTGTFQWNGRIVLIGSSTGGVDALERILSAMPANGPPILIAQHMPAPFLRSFAGRLNSNTQLDVRIAEDGDEIRQGQVLLAPGGERHLGLTEMDRRRTRLIPAEPGDLYVPAVDRLFASAVTHAKHILAVMLTGMGSDGAAPMKTLRDRGAGTLAQSENTCVVAGMPRAARERRAIEESVPLNAMGQAILKRCSKEVPVQC